ncbi:MAG: signal peptidase I [Solirubrobacterales bacterium]|nr:signal peptidase I [Solirubrobacterales bacterium]
MIVALALGLAVLIQAFLIKPYKIPSGSMEPTLDIGQRVLVNRFIYHFNDPKPGDVVVFHPPAGASNGGAECGAPQAAGQPCPAPTREKSSETFIKRIVAGPGDTVSIRAGLPVVNGQIVKPNGYSINPCSIGGAACNLPREITIPKGHFFMMGDNRGESDDSRFWGPLPEEWLIGKAFATYWPPNRIGGL